jgi:hypothetical protein
MNEYSDQKHFPYLIWVIQTGQGQATWQVIGNSIERKSLLPFRLKRCLAVLDIFILRQ